MKEITRIHLAKTPFSVEIDAKKSLEKYLNLIQKNMHAEPEAMREIEARMVELLAERGVSKDGVISHDDVLAVQKQMGEPRDFSDDDEVVETDDEPERSERSERRLMRDTEHALIGGVCAGIAAYWGTNPLWIRLLFIFSPFITFGAAVLIYIVMWLSVPEARTASDKLQMRGKAVTFDSLKRQASRNEPSVGRNSNTGHTAAKVFRFILGVGILMVTLGLFIALIVGAVSGIAVIGLLDGFYAQPWAWGLWASLLIGGVAAVWLGAILSHSAFTWTLKRLSVIMTVVALIVGALSVSGMTLFGVGMANELARDEERLTKIVPVELPSDMKGVKYVHVEGEDASLHFGDTTRGDIKVELRYIDLKGKRQQPKVSAVRDGDKLVLRVENQRNRCRTTWFGLSPELDVNCFGFVRLHVSGPLSPSPAPQSSDA